MTNPNPAPVASATGVPIDNLKTVFNIFQHLNWAEIGEAISKRTLESGVATAEDVANTVVSVGAAAGQPIAVAAEAFLPAAWQMVNLVVGVFQGIGGHSAPVAKAANAAQGSPLTATSTGPAP